jgi:hypothetical protein
MPPSGVVVLGETPRRALTRFVIDLRIAKSAWAVVSAGYAAAHEMSE